MPEVPDIDGVPIDQIIKMGDLEFGGCYMRAEATSEREFKSRRKFTAFVFFQSGGLEELDIMATDETDARIIAALALQWHYEPNWIISDIKQWPEGVTFHHFY